MSEPSAEMYADLFEACCGCACEVTVHARSGVASSLSSKPGWEDSGSGSLPTPTLYRVRTTISDLGGGTHQRQVDTLSDDVWPAFPTITIYDRVTTTESSAVAPVGVTYSVPITHADVPAPDAIPETGDAAGWTDTTGDPVTFYKDTETVTASSIIDRTLAFGQDVQALTKTAYLNRYNFYVGADSYVVPDAPFPQADYTTTYLEEGETVRFLPWPGQIPILMDPENPFFTPAPEVTFNAIVSGLDGGSLPFSYGVPCDPLTAYQVLHPGASFEVTGTVDMGDDAEPGDTITLTLNGTPYVTTLAGDYTWAVDVDGDDLHADHAATYSGYYYEHGPAAKGSVVVVNWVRADLVDGAYTNHAQERTVWEADGEYYYSQTTGGGILTSSGWIFEDGSGGGPQQALINSNVVSALAEDAGGLRETVTFRPAGSCATVFRASWFDWDDNAEGYLLWDDGTVVLRD